MKSRFGLLLLSICFVTIGCSAPTVFNLETTDSEYNYHKGNKVVWREDSIATTLLNFEYHEGEYFSFYTEITNNSNSTYLVDPALFYAEIIKPSSKGIAVIDPELKIKQIEDEIRDTESSKEAAIGMNIIFGLFNVVADIASDAPPEEVVDDVAFWGTSAHNEAVEHDIAKENLHNLKLYWEKNVLRKTTLAPGDYIGGLFYLPVQYDAELLKLVVKVAETEHKFIFEQRGI
ncbi:MAG: hypothetical protein ABFS12_18025, partial [Bacteroidota bacterium]